MPVPPIIPPLIPEALRRRARLARQRRPAGISTPPARLLWRELAVLLGARRTPDLGHVAERPGPVMLLPGFGAHPARMRPMAEALGQAGHRVFDWGLGFNFGPTPDNFAFLLNRVTRIAREQGRPVALVGWSLGGLFAREIAKQRPAQVALVITLGSPFSGIAAPTTPGGPISW